MMKCSTCTSPQQESIDLELLSGRSTFAELSARFSISESSLQRHASSHLKDYLSLAGQEKRREALNLIGHLGSLVNEIQEIRAQAGQGTESFRVRLKSIEIEGSLLLKISDRLGVDQVVIKALKEIKVLASVLGPILLDNPAIARELGEGLRGRGVDELAEACLAQAERGKLEASHLHSEQQRHTLAHGQLHKRGAVT